jgi:U3 small nucleolar RNA-associated protein 18
MLILRVCLASRFEKMHPAPAWAVEARRKVLKKRSKPSNGRMEADSDDDDESSDDEMSGDEDEVDDLFRSAGGKKKAPKKGLLKAGEIDIDRVRDANQAEASVRPRSPCFAVYLPC